MNNHNQNVATSQHDIIKVFLFVLAGAQLFKKEKKMSFSLTSRDSMADAKSANEGEEDREERREAADPPHSPSPR
jgi:hypothetical protein